MGYFWTVVFFATAVVLLLPIPGFDDAMRLAHVPAWSRWALLPVCLVDLVFMRLSWRVIFVDDGGLRLGGLLGQRRVAWSSIEHVAPLGDTLPWLPRAWRAARRIRYIASGRSRSVLVFSDMINSDRLFVSIRERVGQAPAVATYRRS